MQDMFTYASLFTTSNFATQIQEGGQSALQGKPGFRHLIFNAKTGDKEALSLIVYKLDPALKKHSRRISYAGAYNDLIIWLLDAIDQYQA